MKILAIVTIGLASFAADAAEPAMVRDDLTETSCSFMVSRGTEPSTFVEIPDLKVLHSPASQGQLDVQLDPGVSLDGVVCWRSSAELGPNDDWVARTGVPLYIKKDGGDVGSPVLVLELTDPGYRVRVISGPDLAPEQTRRTSALVDVFNKRR